MFWVALSKNNKVVGMIGTKTVYSTDRWLKRLFVNPGIKRTGLGSALLHTAEGYACSKGIKTIHTRFAYHYKDASLFYPTKGFIEVERGEGVIHMNKSIGDTR